MSVVVPLEPQYSFLWLSPVCFRKLHGIFFNGMTRKKMTRNVLKRKKN